MEFLSGVKRVHFIGIGGVSMRVLAEYTTNFAEVTGSDREDCECFEHLRQKGVFVYAGSDVTVVDAADLIIYTGAVPNNDIELAFAREKGIRTLERCEYLKTCADTCRFNIAVAGTHGKTTTSGLLSHIFNRAEMQMLAHVGGDITDIGGNYLYTGNDVFITEACEYQQSFLCLTPDIGIITNIEYDHPDSYASIKEVRNAFSSFAQNSRIILINDCYKDDIERGQVITFGYDEDSDYRIADLESNCGRYTFSVYKRGNFFERFGLSVFGAHNIMNAAACIAAADLCGIKAEKIKEAVLSYHGAKRRFECKGLTESGARVISDYAHHPDEIRCSIDTAREIAGGKIILCFEPHTYSRTKNLIEEFSECFYWADELIILPTYAAREKPEAGMNALDLCAILREKGRLPVYIDNYDSAVENIDKIAQKGDLILVMGAGTVDKVADLLFLKEK